MDLANIKYFLFHPSTITWALHSTIVIVLAVRVIMNRPATGVALAWLLLIAAAPFVGALIYLLVGERRIGRERTRGIEILRKEYRARAQALIPAEVAEINWSRHANAARGMDRLGRNMVGYPTVQGGKIQLYSDTPEILKSIARDVDAAKSSVLMEFYIWNEGGHADEVLEAVTRAAQRGVSCRILIDALGARPWWNGTQPSKMRAAGVDVRPALPVNLFRTFVGRTDLRVHRKIVVIDGTIGWTGSMNMVDPRFFKQDSGVGEWVDAMVRVQGNVVLSLATTMIGDWVLETRESLDEISSQIGLRLVGAAGSADVQIIPSGPGQTSDGLLQMILAMIHSAQNELVLTTPYLVPDDSLLRALRGAAASGVRVRLIVPEKVDSFMTRYASRSYYDDLLDVGVEIYMYRGGLLHTKSIVVDNSISLFGTVNLDMRSIWLNYEVALLVFDNEFGAQLRQLQQSYIADSTRLDPETWNRRSFGNRFLENSLRLVSPLL